MEFFVYYGKIFLYYPERRSERAVFGLANGFAMKRRFKYF